VERSGSGNTRLRHAAVTIFNSNMEAIKLIAADSRVRYCIAQEEVCPETKREHIQSYWQFTSPIRFNALQKLLPPGAHIECARGTPEENRQYCSKLDSRKTDCSPFESGECTSQGKRKDLNDFCDAIDKGAKEADILDNHELRPVWCKYQGLYKRYKQAKIRPRNRETCPDVTFFTGAPGVGKTKRVFDEHKDDVFVKDNTKWWDGYEGQRCILIDELDTHDHWRIEEMLRFLDRYPYQGQTKGGYVNINSPFIAITSNKTLNDLYPSISEDQMNALTRRINTVVQL